MAPPRVALPPEAPREQVALLLPLSGPNAPLGEAALAAAQLALFERGGPGIELVPHDTGGTSLGAAQAARAALAGGARAIVGPLTAPEARAVGPLARQAGAPVFAFTNDPTVAGPSLWPLGISPDQQVRRLVGHAAAGGARRLALVAPEGPFGRALAEALRAATRQAGLPEPLVAIYPPAAAPGVVARDVLQRAGDAPPEAVLIGEAGERAGEMAAALVGAGLAVPPARLLGSALWHGEPRIASEARLAGAVFPGPDPGARARFESRFEGAFGTRPSRIAATAYDATAIGIAALRARPAEAPVGEELAGADGPLRLGPNGQVLRGLALFAIEPGLEPRLVEPAPAAAPGS
ncbi:MAG: penicillin-binding protein activator [Acetobacteraceae bacterium]|nr:penicillin-binding protein activator [Acetobacteraceae bacterium]